MKKIFFIFLLFLFVQQSISAQDVIYPFKKDVKFGLSDSYGNLLVQPDFDEMEWVMDKYFVGTKKLENSSNSSKTLFYGSKKLIDELNAIRFQIVPEMLIVSTTKIDKSENLEQNSNISEKDLFYFSLYDFKGKRVGEKQYKRLELVAQTEISERNPKISKYALFFSQDFEDSFSMFVFDSDKRLIKDFLIQNVKEFKVVSKDFKTGSYFIRYQDSENIIQNKELVFSPKYFELKNAENKPQQTRPIREDQKEIENIYEAISNSSTLKENYPLYIKKKNKIFYKISDSDRVLVGFKKKEKFIFFDSELNKQTQNLIFKEKSKYGLVIQGQKRKAEYDSLIYFGSENFLACKKSLKNLCGILNKIGNPLIPLEFDSIKNLGYFSNGKNDVQDLERKNPKSGNYFYANHQNLLVYKNGKVGLFKNDGSKILEIEYDEIGINYYPNSENKETEFLVLKNNDLYGLVFNSLDSQTEQNIQHRIEPIFKNYPAFYYKDYYGQSGEFLFGLIDEDGNLQEYASEFGFHFSN